MKCSEKQKMELSDILVPQLFISNYMISLDENSLKTYLYFKFLCKNCVEIQEAHIIKKLGMNKVEYAKAMSVLEEEELIIKTEDGYDIMDLKEQEINRTYMPKIKSNSNKATTQAEQRRIAAASAINESFFQGVMSLGWYVDISTLFEKYMFDGDVMIALFHYCQERKALKKNYVFKVAEGWYKSNVKTFVQLEEYFEAQDKVNKIKARIKKAMGLIRNLTEYEEDYINKWINEYKYGIDIIELALKKTVKKTTNPTINYANGIIGNWNKKGFKTLEEIVEEDNKVTKEMLEKVTTKSAQKLTNIKQKNYEQRKYENLESYYDNI